MVSTATDSESNLSPAGGRKRCRPSSSQHHAALLDESQIKRNILLRSITQSTPWADWYELVSVGKALLSTADAVTGDSQTISEALESVAIWRARSHRLPHAIDSSAVLAQILWRDYHSSSSRPSSTTIELSLSYASAIIRSINGLADALHQDRAVATSIAQRSSQLGIPNWLVEIRHQATHNQLPSLAVLRLAATTLLHYFEAVYWEPLMKKRDECNQQATKWLEAYPKALQRVNEQLPNAPPDITEASASEKGVLVDDIDGEQECADDSEDSDDQDSDNMRQSLFGSKIGTSINSFALLQEPKKKKKKDSPKTEKQKKRKKKIKSKGAEPTPHECLTRFVKLKIPADIAYNAALEFLVNKSQLVPTDNLDSFPWTASGFKKLRHQYSAFLISFIKKWPGFLAALVYHLVDTIIVYETILKDTQDVSDVFVTTRKLFYFSAWVGYLLTNAFLSNFIPSLTVRKSDGTKPAPYWCMTTVGLPLFTLRDKCKESGDNISSEASRTRHLHDLFQQVIESAQSNETTYKMAVTLNKTSVSGQPGDELVDESAASPWEFCEEWDACSIGSSKVL